MTKRTAQAQAAHPVSVATTPQLAADTPPPTITFLSRKQVLALVGVSYATLWSWIKEGEFPPACVLNPKQKGRTKIAWLEHEVRQWMATRPRRLPKGSAAA
jgi:predicted DNA-binding transcriptional regulator AlpA